MADIKVSRGMYKGSKTKGKGTKQYKEPTPKKKVYKPKKVK